MGTKIIYAAMILAGACASANAQTKGKPKTETTTRQQETVVIDRDKDAETVVEIKDGTIYVNGEAVSGIKDLKNEDHRIVIKNKDHVEGKPILDSILDSWTAHKVMLGVFADNNGDDNGAVIVNIMPGSPAYAAGLQTGDVITKIDDHDIKNPKDLVDVISSYKEAGSVSVTYRRSGSTHHTRAQLTEATPDLMGQLRRTPGTLEEMPGGIDNYLHRADPFMFGEGPFGGKPKMGITAEDADKNAGVVIKEVKPNTPAELAGLRVGDIITRIDNKKINTVDELMDHLLFANAYKKMKVEYLRNGEKHTTDLQLSKPVSKDL